LGTLTYNTTFATDFDDRVLAHLQLVIGAKLRRGESFHFSWKNAPTVGGGRTILWLHPTMPLVYTFESETVPPINRRWTDAMMEVANGPAGLQIVPEPEVPPTAVTSA